MGGCMDARMPGWATQAGDKLTTSPPSIAVTKVGGNASMRDCTDRTTTRCKQRRCTRAQWGWGQHTEALESLNNLQIDAWVSSQACALCGAKGCCSWRDLSGVAQAQRQSLNCIHIPPLAAPCSAVTMSIGTPRFLCFLVQHHMQLGAPSASQRRVRCMPQLEYPQRHAPQHPPMRHLLACVR